MCPTHRDDKDGLEDRSQEGHDQEGHDDQEDHDREDHYEEDEEAAVEEDAADQAGAGMPVATVEIAPQTIKNDICRQNDDLNPQLPDKSSDCPTPSREIPGNFDKFRECIHVTDPA